MIVIFDLDGTLALIDHRRPLVTCDKKDRDWGAFYEACVDDEPNEPVIAMFKALRAQGHEMWIFSGRSDVVQIETKLWLNSYGIKFDRLVMREEGDNTPDEELKKEWFHRNIGGYGFYELLCVFDDRQKVVNMWRDIGVTCFQVAPGDF